MGISRLSEFWPDWRVTELLGEGSYGKVYKAEREDHSFKSLSAIKVISIPNNPAELRSLHAEGLSEADTRSYLEGIVTDFVNEIKLMESLDGAPNIVFVKDYKILEKKEGIGWDIYIRMELLKSFDRLMEEKRLNEDEILKLSLDLCSALEACSTHRIIHRDIKPANIFVSQYGTYKIGDFGVAKELEKTTGTLSAKGTFSYMAPEVAHGHKYDATVDIYSLGIVMYTLLNNNRQPFIDPHSPTITYNDRKSATDRRLSGEALPAPCNASPELASIILTACAYNPKQRFRTPTALKNAILNYINLKNSPVPQPAPSIPAPEKAPEIKEAEKDIDATVAVPHTPHRETMENETDEKLKQYFEENNNYSDSNRDVKAIIIVVIVFLIFMVILSLYPS